MQPLFGISLRSISGSIHKQEDLMPQLRNRLETEGLSNPDDELAIFIKSTGEADRFGDQHSFQVSIGEYVSKGSFDDAPNINSVDIGQKGFVSGGTFGQGASIFKVIKKATDFSADNLSQAIDNIIKLIKQ